MRESEAQRSDIINNTFCLFIPEALSTKANVRGIQHALEDHYPQSANSSVLSIDSIISRKGILRQKRFELMADRILGEYNAHRAITALVYSYGAPEFVKTMAHIEKEYPALFEDGSDFLSNINLAMVAPFGFMENAGQVGQLITRFARMVHTHKDVPFIPPSPLKGVAAVSLIPIVGMNASETSDALRKAYPELSQANGAGALVDLKTIRDFTEQANFSPAEAVEIAELDVCLCAAAKNQQWSVFRSLLTQRGLLLRRHLAIAHTGVYFADKQTHDNEEIEEGILRKTAQALLGFKHIVTLFMMSLKGKPYKKIAELKAKGMKVKMIILEFDTMVMLAEAKAFLGELKEGESPNIVVLPRATHSSFMYQGEDVVKALRALGL